MSKAVSITLPSIAQGTIFPKIVSNTGSSQLPSINLNLPPPNLHSQPNFQLLYMCSSRSELNDNPSRKVRFTDNHSKRIKWEGVENDRVYSSQTNDQLKLPPRMNRHSEGVNVIEGIPGISSRYKSSHSKVCAVKAVGNDQRSLRDNLLCQAILEGKFRYVKLQVRTGANINVTNALGQTLPMKCCFIENKARRLNMFTLLVQCRADLTLADNSGKTVLHYAAILGDAEIIRVILSNTLSLDLNGHDHCYKTPLLYAVHSGNPEAVKALVQALRQYDLSVDVGTPTGITPYIEARRLGKIGIARILLDEGLANPFQSDDKYFRSPNEWAFLASARRQSLRYNSDGTVSIDKELLNDYWYPRQRPLYKDPSGFRRHKTLKESTQQQHSSSLSVKRAKKPKTPDLLTNGVKSSDEDQTSSK